MEGINKIINSKSRTFLAFCFCFVLGVAATSAVGLAGAQLYRWYISLLAVLFALTVFWSRRKSRFLLLALLFFVLGGIRVLLSVPPNDASHVRYYNGGKAELVGWVADEPEMKVDGAEYVINVERLYLWFGEKKVSGKALLRAGLFPAYRYGDELSITCILKSARDRPDSVFVYSKHLERRGVHSICYNAEVRMFSTDKGSRLKKNILRLKSSVGEEIRALWPEPESALLAGLLYGDRSGFPRELMENFNRAGITHIVAISGYNITIITAALLMLLIYLGLSRRQAFWAVVCGVGFFVLFTGASASVVRAGIMGVVVLLAQQLGRLSRPIYVLSLAVVLMLLANPLILLWDAGFQLSFMATIGLLYLSPRLEDWLGVNEGVDRGFVLTVQRGLISTFSAVFFTLPLILYQFGRLSLAAPLANILILWLIPYLMLFGFMAVVVSFIFFPLGQVMAWLAGIGLKYVIILAEYFGQSSWSSASVRISGWLMALAYAALLFLLFNYASKNKGSASERGV